MKSIFNIVLFMTYSLNAIAQRPSIGAKVGYMTGFEMIASPTQVGEKPLSRVTLTVDAGVSKSIGGGLMYGVENPVDRWAIGLLYNHWMVDLSSSFKYKPFRNSTWRVFRTLNLSGGAGYWLFGVLDEDPLVLEPENPDMGVDVLPMAREFNDMRWFTYAIQESFNRHALLVRAAASFDFSKRFTSEISYEQTLTPIGSRLTFRDETFAFHQHSRRIVVSLGYRIFMLDKRKREAKNKV